MAKEEEEENLVEVVESLVRVEEVQGAALEEMVVVEEHLKVVVLLKLTVPPGLRTAPSGASAGQRKAMPMVGQVLAGILMRANAAPTKIVPSLPLIVPSLATAEKRISTVLAAQDKLWTQSKLILKKVCCICICSNMSYSFLFC